MDFALEAYDEQALPFKYTAIAENLLQVRAKIALEGMSRDEANTLQSISHGMFDDIGLNRFTQFPSNTLRNVALERIDFKRVGIIAAAAAAIIFIITKVISWLAQSFGALGGAGGAITNVDKTVAQVSRAAEKVVPVAAEVTIKDVVQPPVVAALETRYLTTEDSIQNNYIHKLAKLVKDKNLNQRQAQTAAANYVNVITRTLGLSERDTMQHMVVGEMLLSKNGALPAVLECFDWLSGNGKGFGSEHSMALFSWLSRVIDIVTELNIAMDGVGKISGATTDTDGNYIIEGTLKNAMHNVVNLTMRISDIIDKSMHDGLAPLIHFDHELKGVMSETGLEISGFSPNMTRDWTSLIDQVRDRTGESIGMWTDGEYQGTKVLHPSEHPKVLAAVLDTESLQRFGRFYAGYIVDGKPRNAEQLKSLQKKLDSSKQIMKLLQSKATDGSYLTARLTVKSHGKDVSLEIMKTLVDSLRLAEKVMTIVQSGYAAAGTMAKAAQRAVELPARAAKR